MLKFNEYGRIGQLRYQGIFYEEFLHELRGRKGIETYKEMANNDSIIGGILFAVEMLIRQCSFTIEPAGNKDIDKKASEFVEQCMYDMEYSWTDTIAEILSFLIYGWSYHEIVYKRRMGKSKNKLTNSKYNDGLIGWRKLPIRSQDTLWEWRYEDNSDDLLGLVQAPPPNYPHIFIPLEKSIHFRTTNNKASPEGRSILRTCYRDWYFKKRIQEIEGIGIERDLAGLPVLYGPPDVNLWDGEDPDMVKTLAYAMNIVSGIRMDTKMGLVFPEGWRLELLSSGKSKTFDTNLVIERYNKMIATTVLADFILLGQNQVGSYALSSDKTKLFATAIGTYLDVICEAFSDQAIPRLIEINKDYFKGLTDYPYMNHSDIEEPNLNELSSFISSMVGIGALVPDDNLEKFIRRVGHLPDKLEEDGNEY